MRAVRLYGRVLRLHRRALPPDLRFLGDNYVKEEFRKHRGADSVYEGPFLSAWEQYAEMLEASPGRVPARELEAHEVDSLSDAQVQQLSMLKREASRGLKE